MTIKSLTEALKAVQAIKADAHAVSTITGAAIDTKGFDEVMFVVNAGTFAAGATADIKVQECDTSGGSYADISGAAFTQITDALDDNIYVGRVKCKNWERYLKVVCVVGTDVADLGVVGILGKYDGLAPVTQENTVEFDV